MVDFDGGAEFRLDTSQAEAALERLGNVGEQSLGRLEQRIGSIEQKLSSIGGGSGGQGFQKGADAAERFGNTVSKSLNQARSTSEILDKRIEKLTRDFLLASSAVTQLNKATLGIPTPALTKAKDTMASYRQELTLAVNEANKLGLATANVSRANAAINKAGTGIGRNIGDIVLGVNKLGFTLFALEQTIRSVLAPVAALKRAFFDVGLEIENASISIAGAFNSANLEGFNISLQRSESFMKKLREEALKTNLNFDELVKTSAVALPQLLTRGFTENQSLSIISNLASATKTALGPDFSPARVQDELRGFLTGQVNARTSQTLQILGFTSEELKNLKSTEEAVALLEKRMVGFNAANAKFRERSGGAIEELKDIWLEFRLVVGEPLFDVATESLIGLRNAMRSPEFKDFMLDLAEIAHGVADLTRELAALTAAFFRMIGAMEEFNQQNIQPVLDRTITGISEFFRTRGTIPFIEPDKSLTRLEETRLRQRPENKRAREEQRRREIERELPRATPRDPSRPKFGDPTDQEIKKAKADADKAQREAERDAEEAARRQEQAQKEQFDRQREFLKNNNERQAALIEIAARGSKELAERMKKFGQEGFFPPSVELALEHERDAVEELIDSYEKGLDRIKNAASVASTALSAFAKTGIGAAKIELESLGKQIASVQGLLGNVDKSLPVLKAQLESARDTLDSLALSANQAGIQASIARESEIFSKGLVGKSVAHPTGGAGVITGRFGEARPGHRHAGVDIAAPKGSAVFAPLGGKVVTAGQAGAFGNLVKIEVGDGLEVLLGHLSKVLVKVGQQVEAGAKVGVQGSTGRSTGDHVHAEFRQDGRAVNPAPFLKNSAKLTKEQLASAAASSKASQGFEQFQNIASDAMGTAADRVRNLQDNFRTLEERQIAARLEIAQLGAEVVKQTELEAKATDEFNKQIGDLKTETDRLNESLHLTAQQKAFASLGDSAEDAERQIKPLVREMERIQALLKAGGQQVAPGLFHSFSKEEIAELNRSLEFLQATIDNINAKTAVSQLDELNSALDSVFNNIANKKGDIELERGFLPDEQLIQEKLLLESLALANANWITSFKEGEKVMINGKGFTISAEMIEEYERRGKVAIKGIRDTIQEFVDFQQRQFREAQEDLNNLSNFLTKSQLQSAQVALNNAQIQHSRQVIAGGGLSRDSIREQEVLIAQAQANNRDLASSVIDTVIEPIQAGFDSMFDAILEGEGDFGKIFLDTMKNVVRGLQRMFSEVLFDQLKQNILKGGGGFLGSGIRNITQGFIGGQTPDIGGGSFLPPIQGTDTTAQIQQTKAFTSAVTQGVDQSSLAGKVSGIAQSLQTASTNAANAAAQAQGPGFGGVNASAANAKKQLGLLLAAGFGLGQITAASRTADETGKAQPFQGALGGILSGASLGFQFGGKRGALLGGLGGGLFGLTQGFPETSPIRQVGGGILGGAFTGFQAAGPVGGVVGGLLGGIMGLFGLGKARKAQRQAERHRYQDTVLAPFLNNLVNTANPNDFFDLKKRFEQASRGMKANGERGMEMKRAAMDQLRAMIKDARKRAEEIAKGLDDLIEDMKRPVHLRDTVPELKGLMRELKEALDLGVDPQKVFAAFQARVADQVREMQDEINAINEQIIHGDENQRGELISLQEGMRQRIIEIQKEGQKELESLREGVASEASGILSEGRASAIIPSAESRQKRLSRLFAKAGREDTEIKEDIRDAILREQNTTAREIADLQSEAVKIQQNILLLLEKAIELAPAELKRTTNAKTAPTFTTQELQSLLEFVKTNQFNTLVISNAGLGGLPGVTIENLNISNEITDEELGRLIREEIERREASRANNRTAQAA